VAPGGRRRASGLDSTQRFGGNDTDERTGEPVEGEPMAPAKDPVCGMEVDTDTDLHYEYEGETYYFCSRGCKLEFEEDPEKYLDPEYEPHM
jgi:YHS domain-containing protein